MKISIALLSNGERLGWTKPLDMLRTGWRVGREALGNGLTFRLCDLKVFSSPTHREDTRCLQRNCSLSVPLTQLQTLQ